MTIKASGAIELKCQFKEIRNECIQAGKITHSKFESYVLSEEPEYNSDRGKKKIYNVYYGRASSLNLLGFMKNFQNAIQ